MLGCYGSGLEKISKGKKITYFVLVLQIMYICTFACSGTTMKYSPKSQAVRIGRKTSNAFELANPLYGDTMSTRTAMSSNDDARMIANAGNN